MPHEFVFEPQRVVEDTGFAEHDRVVERAAECEAILAQHFDVFEECEGARRRDFFDKTLFSDPDGARLMTEERMIVADAVGNLEMI